MPGSGRHRRSAWYGVRWTGLVVLAVSAALLVVGLVLLAAGYGRGSVAGNHAGEWGSFWQTRVGASLIGVAALGVAFGGTVQLSEASRQPVGVRHRAD